MSLAATDCRISEGVIRSAPSTAALPRAVGIPFADFNNRYAGQSCYIIGRGRTDFDYRNLIKIREPVFFINDAVCLEIHVCSESFFFAHDPQPLKWMDGSMTSTPVLPIDGKLGLNTAQPTLDHAGNIVYYHWRQHRGHELLSKTRDELGRICQLYTNTGTIHSLLHFVWFCGFREVSLIGCDGLRSTPPNSSYDPRLPNRSGPLAGPHYPLIRRTQDSLLQLFGIKSEYLGTPA